MTKYYKNYFMDRLGFYDLVIVPTIEECDEYLKDFAYDYDNEDYKFEIEESIQEFIEQFTKDGIEKQMFTEYRKISGCSKNEFKKCIFFIGSLEDLKKDIKTYEEVPADIIGYINDTFTKVKYGYVEYVF